MNKISRRGLFGFVVGAMTVPFLKPEPDTRWTAEEATEEAKAWEEHPFEKMVVRSYSQERGYGTMTNGKRQVFVSICAARACSIPNIKEGEVYWVQTRWSAARRKEMVWKMRRA